MNDLMQALGAAEIAGFLREAHDEEIAALRRQKKLLELGIDQMILNRPKKMKARAKAV